MLLNRTALVLEKLRKNPDGASLAQLLEALETQMSRRSLQRALKELVDKGLVLRKGKASSTRYILPRENTAQESVQFDIPLSPEAVQLAVYLQKPLNERKSVTYNRSF
jgi:DNA-binding transcriptional ArsR family regulator